MRTLVIGGNGFIGSHVVEALQKVADDIRVLDVGARRSDVDWSGVDYRQGAFTVQTDLDDALKGVDRVYHLASTTVPGTSNANPVSDIECNLIGTVKLLERMRAKGVNRIVYFSSGGTVYGNPTKLPIGEDHPTHPISSYGIVKLSVEKYLQMYQSLHGLCPLILRPANPYGPRQGTTGIQGVIAAFFARHRRGEPIRVWGDGTIVRDYIYVSDLSALTVKAGQSAIAGVFNVGSGRGYSLNQVIASMADILGSPLVVERLPGRDFDVREVVLDITRAQTVFSWFPSVSLDEGLKRTWQWLVSQSG
jgi:UDP-glucose 4-epimerase